MSGLVHSDEKWNRALGTFNPLAAPAKHALGFNSDPLCTVLRYLKSGSRSERGIDDGEDPIRAHGHMQI